MTTKKLSVTEQFVRMHARRIVQNGYPVLTTNGDPLLIDAFKELGWSDPYLDPAELEAEAKTKKAADEAFEKHRQREEDLATKFEAAKQSASERAVLDRPEDHTN